MKNKPQISTLTTSSSSNGIYQSETPSPPLISPHIQTRSATQRYNSTPPTRSNSRNHVNNGKIVKPIALRALSSSASSVSSSLSTNLSASQTAKNALIASALHQQQQQQQHQACSCQSKPCKCMNFSLIAKYFASFPANRLKQQQNQNTSKISPFAIPQSVKNKDAELCKHFNHIVKLNDPPQTLPPAPAPLQPPQSPILQSSPEIINKEITPASLDHRTVATSNQQQKPQTSSPQPQELSDDDGYNQITMETRSTRKFLIKYHPYLSQNRIIAPPQNSIENQKKLVKQAATKSSSISQMELRKHRKRPSINLIKMTKLSPPPPIFTPDDNLVKFIDTAVVDSTTNIEINKKIICNCNATIQQYTQKKQQQQQQEDISSICGSKSSNADAESGYYSDLNFKLNDSLSSNNSSIFFNQHHHQQQQQTVLPKHNYYTRYNAAITTHPSLVVACKLNCSSTSSNCTCDLDLNQIEND